ncbi:MAG TPA: hypothetical protein DCQ98_04835 [Planctomycetaceae bacterium]|nr:hypothetical protein [Planctomycetaceae bacterium]HRE99252.1 DUF3341 domain-containing protein [Pirellulaceae bacterium]
MAHRPRPASTEPQVKFLGYLAEFDDPHRLVEACDRVRQAGYKKIDAYSPFPVHGIDPALGIRPTRLPFLVLAVGLGAAVVGVLLQWYTNATDEYGPFPGYKFLISGKPTWSLPANIPVVFEIIVLSSAFATFLGMWGLNRLPMFSNPLFRLSRFKRVTSDRFFLMVGADDPIFDSVQTKQQLERFGALGVERIEHDQRDAALPGFIKPVAICLMAAALLPPAAIYRDRGMTNTATRLHFNPDMDWQDKSKTQTVSPGLSGVEGSLFADGRAMRGDVPGTVAVGELREDDRFYRGYEQGTEVPADAPLNADGSRPEPEWITSFPDNLPVDQTLMERGERQYGIYCAVCHGHGGYGDGLVSRRALELQLQNAASWTQAKSLHDPAVVAQPLGRIFDTISNGRNTMGPYRAQISPEDRWAIVLYVKALQATRADAGAPPAEAN